MAREGGRFDLVVFDWDGTLIDSTGLIVRAIQAACADLGLDVPGRERAAHVIGLGLFDAMREIAPQLAESECRALAERYRHHYFSRDHELVLFEGAQEVLEWIKAQGYLLAVATGKARAGLSRALDSTGLARLFDATRCADESFSKPHPAMLLELMDELATDPVRTLMVGDTTHDLLMARNAGVPALAMSYGAHSVEELNTVSPLAMLHTMDQLRGWLLCNG